MTVPRQVFLAGEGRNELGSRCAERPYQTDEEVGVLVALLQLVTPEGWVVAGAAQWSTLARRRGRASYVSRTSPKYARLHGDARAVLVAANDALDLTCDVFAFVRDSDGDLEREAAVEEGIRQIAELALGPLDVVGGVAHPKLEAWILAAAGVTNSESLSRHQAEARLAEHGIASKDTKAMVEVIERWDPMRSPTDATRLAKWLARAEAVFGAAAPTA